jgi:hypothetical protein
MRIEVNIASNPCRQLTKSLNELIMCVMPLVSGCHKKREYVTSRCI